MKHCRGGTKPLPQSRENTRKRTPDIKVNINRRSVIRVETSNLALPRILPAIPLALPGKDARNSQIQFCKERLTHSAGQASGMYNA